MTYWMNPSEVKRLVSGKLPPHWGISVKPKDSKGRRSPAYAADYYEIFAYPVTMSDPLDEVAETLWHLPAIISVTQRTAEVFRADTSANPVRPGVYARMPAGLLSHQPDLRRDKG